jgi:hypothetical protein
MSKCEGRVKKEIDLDRIEIEKDKRKGGIE